MPVTMQIDTDENVTYTTIEGAWTVDELFDAFDKLLADPDFRPGTNGIADLRAANYYPSGPDLMRIAHYLLQRRERFGRCRAAILVGGDLSFGTTRMFQAYSDDSTIATRIFRDQQEARRWLGLDG